MNSCERRDSNSHRLPYWNLNPARLPIPPLSQRGREYRFSFKNSIQSVRQAQYKMIICARFRILDLAVMNYLRIKKLPSVKKLTKSHPLSQKGRQQILQDRKEIQHILEGADERLLVIVGP